MTDNADNQKEMFFRSFRFNPTETLKQSELNRFLAFFFSKGIGGEDDPDYEIQELETSMHTLVKVLLDLGITFNTDEAFKELPDDLKRHFVAQYRDGTIERYNRQTMPDL